MDHFLSGLEGHHHPSWYGNPGRATLLHEPHEFAVGPNSFQLIPLQGSCVTAVSSASLPSKSHATHSMSSAENASKFSHMASAAASLIASAGTASKLVIDEGKTPIKVEALEDRSFPQLGIDAFPIGPVRSSHQSKEGKKADTKRICNICGKVLSRGDKLKNHIRIHTNNFPYHCDTCGQGFLRSEGLRIHTRIHTGERPYVCIVCGKAYTRKDKLTRHAIVHTGERPFVCQYCEKTFTRKDKMQRHELIHKVEKPWTCVPCNLEFVRQEGFNAHMEKKHPERLPYTLVQHNRPLIADSSYRPPNSDSPPYRPPAADSPPSPGYIIHEGVSSNHPTQSSLSAITQASRSSNSAPSSSEEIFSAMNSNIKTLALLSSRIPGCMLPQPES